MQRKPCNETSISMLLEDKKNRSKRTTNVKEAYYYQERSERETDVVVSSVGHGLEHMVHRRLAMFDANEDACHRPKGGERSEGMGSCSHTQLEHLAMEISKQQEVTPTKINRDLRCLRKRREETN